MVRFGDKKALKNDGPELRVQLCPSLILKLERLNVEP